MVSTIAPPMGLIAELTHRCPLQCPYCANPMALHRVSAELDTATWRRVLEEAAALGVLQLHFTGGEPTARKDLVELAQAAARLGLYSNLITSGVCWTSRCWTVWFTPASIMSRSACRTWSPATPTGSAVLRRPRAQAGGRAGGETIRTGTDAEFRRAPAERGARSGDDRPGRGTRGRAGGNRPCAVSRLGAAQP